MDTINEQSKENSVNRAGKKKKVGSPKRLIKLVNKGNGGIVIKSKLMGIDGSQKGFLFKRSNS